MVSNNKLYVVATPIGNLAEMTPRAIETLQKVVAIFCEDTRETFKLCHYFQISKPLFASHEHNERFNVDKILTLLETQGDVALVSDAGYPGISDPGTYIIQKVIEQGYDIVVISGPSAIINALVGSGLDTTHFYFHGFLPSKRGDRKRDLEKLKKKEETLIFYESPHRVEDTLKDMVDTLGNRAMALCRELTKKFEEYLRGTIEEVLEEMIKREIKGEIVLVVSGHPKEEVVTVSNMEIIASVNALIQEGKTTKDAIKEVATKYEIGKNEIYRIYHQ